jgi:hypothetical protein
MRLYHAQSPILLLTPHRCPRDHLRVQQSSYLSKGTWKIYITRKQGTYVRHSRMAALFTPRHTLTAAVSDVSRAEVASTSSFQLPTYDTNCSRPDAHH